MPQCVAKYRVEADGQAGQQTGLSSYGDDGDKMCVKLDPAQVLQPNPSVKCMEMMVSSQLEWLEEGGAEEEQTTPAVMWQCVFIKIQ